MRYTHADQAPEIEVRATKKEACQADGVTIVLEWTQENPLSTYYIDIDPQNLLSLVFNGVTNVTLGMSYNTLYNVSVLAGHLCGDSNVTIFTQLFYYGRCKLKLMIITQKIVESY